MPCHCFEIDCGNTNGNQLVDIFIILNNAKVVFLI